MYRVCASLLRYTPDKTQFFWFWSIPAFTNLHFLKETEVVLCTTSFQKHPWLGHELRTIHLQVLLEESHLSICYLLLYSPKYLTPDVAMTPQTCRTHLSRRLLKLEDWPTLCWNQVESRSPQPHVLESKQATALELANLEKEQSEQNNWECSRHKARQQNNWECSRHKARQWPFHVQVNFRTDVIIHNIIYGNYIIFAWSREAPFKMYACSLG